MAVKSPGLVAKATAAVSASKDHTGTVEPVGISRSVSWVGEATEPQLVGSTSNVGGQEVKPFTLP